MSAWPVLVYSEQPDVARELLTPGRALAGSGLLVAVHLGPRGAPEVESLAAHGADRVITSTGVGSFQGDAYAVAAALARMIERVGPGIVLVGATREGVEVASRVGQRLRAACAHRCTSFALDGDKLVVERGWLGRLVARQRLETRPALATVAPRRFEPPVPATSYRTAVEVVELAAVPPGLRVISSRPRAASRVELERARVVVSAGRGLRRPEDIEMVARLARALGGEVGASRPLTDYLQWLPADVKVGLSGHTVRPELYVACGISGQIEHIVGMRESRVVVAINLDPGAPIFREADYCVVGDLYAIIPALERAVAALAG